MSRSALRFALLVVCCAPPISLSAGITRNWTGAVSTNFSEPANWSPAGVPATDDSLVFPAATVNNDLPPGTAFGPITFNGNVTLNGNAMTLTGHVAVAPAHAVTCNADLKIAAPLTLGDITGGGVFYSTIDVNGQTLTFSGPAFVKSLNGVGTVVVGPALSLIHVVQDSTFAGTFMGGVIIGGSMPNANVVHNGASWPYVAGNGTLGSVEAWYVAPGEPAVIGTLATKSIDILNTGAWGNGVYFDLNAAGPSDLIQVAGTVTLEKPPLIVNLNSGTPVFGQRFRLIDNDGTDAVIGTFLNLPEGAAVNVNGAAFRITYAGGDGNDVELIVAATPSAAVSQSKDSSVIGESFALNAAVTSGLGTPAGTVTFVDNGVAIGTAPLSNGSASLNVSTLTPGSHTITAVYSGGDTFFGVVSGAIAHSVSKGDTTTSIEIVHEPVLFGTAEFRVVSAAKAPAGGTVDGICSHSAKERTCSAADRSKPAVSDIFCFPFWRSARTRSWPLTAALRISFQATALRLRSP